MSLVSANSYPIQVLNSRMFNSMFSSQYQQSLSGTALAHCRSAHRFRRLTCSRARASIRLLSLSLSLSLSLPISLSENSTVFAKTHLRNRNRQKWELALEEKVGVSEKPRGPSKTAGLRCAQEGLKRNSGSGAPGSVSLIARMRGPASFPCALSSSCPPHDGRVGHEGIEEGLPQSATAHHVFPLRRRRAKGPLFY